MILTESSSRKPSRIGFWIVLGMGALLLPLAPQAARTEALEEPGGQEVKNEPFSLDFGFPVKVLADSPLSNQAENCTSCHAVSMPKFDFHGKPQSWREAHDEIVRLMDELHRRQAEFNKAANRPPAVAEPDRSKEIEKLQDEIELLKVQVHLKEAHVDGTRALLNESRRRVDNLRAINRTHPGSIPQDEIAKAVLAVTTQQTQLRINEAELQEPLVRLKQAERRLARLQPAKNQFEVGPKTNWNVTWAEALFDNRTHDLGSVPHGTIVERRFAMTNHGQRPVHIANIRTSNGCLTATASGSDLAPGASAAIQAKLDTSKFVGEKTLKIHVEFDKPDRQEVVLEIHANSKAATPPKPQSPERLRELEKKLDELRKEMDKLRREMPPKESRDPDMELQDAVGFIYNYWPINDTRSLERNLPAAQKAFQKVKAAGDRLSLQRLLTLTGGHADVLAGEMAKLRPDLVIDDEREAKKLQKLRDQMVKLREEIENYLKVHPTGK